MAASNLELNRTANYMTASDMECRLHTADPGGAGVNNRIGTLEATLANANWSDANGGMCQYDATVSFGVIDSNNEQTIAWYSLWRGTEFSYSSAFQSSVTVSAGASFSINTGSISITLSNRA